MNKKVVEEALNELVQLNDWKDKNGKDLYYFNMQPVAWKNARLALETLDFQKRVDHWIQVCFGEEISKDATERNHRFLEESLELVQSLGCTKSEAHQLVDYVFDRPIGDKEQECGGVMVTLAALSTTANMDMDKCGETELENIWQRIEKIRTKQAAKPKHSPLPQ